MTRQEFIRKLQDALNGKLDAATIQDHLKFYDDYIIEEMRKYCLTLFKNETLIENSIQEEKMKILLYNYFYIVHKEDY